VEHLGDSVAGRYLLVAPACPHQARREYHAVDMVADRTVLVRFEPRYGDSHRGESPLKTADGHRVLDGGTFGGQAYVVVDTPIPGSAPGGDLTVTELEAWYAAPSVARPDPPAAGRASARRDRVRLSVVAAAHLVGAVSLVVLLVAVAVYATRMAPAPTRSGPPAVSTVTSVPGTPPDSAGPGEAAP
jgi:hypothetical protein